MTKEFSMGQSFKANTGQATGQPDPRLTTELARAFQAIKDMDGKAAVRYAKKALKIAPGNADCHLIMGSAQQLAGDMRKAEHHLIEALRLQPANVRAAINLGTVKMSQGMGKEAVMILGQAAKIQPDMGEIRYYLGLAYGMVGDFAKSVEQLSYVADTDPPQAPVLKAYAVSLAHNEEMDKAIETFRKAEKLMPQDPEIKALLAECYHKVGNMVEADKLKAEVEEMLKAQG